MQRNLFATNSIRNKFEVVSQKIASFQPKFHLCLKSMPASAIGCKRHVPDPSSWECLDLSTAIKDYEQFNNLIKKNIKYHGKEKLVLRRVGNGKKRHSQTCSHEELEVDLILQVCFLFLFVFSRKD